MQIRRSARDWQADVALAAVAAALSSFFIFTSQTTDPPGSLPLGAELIALGAAAVALLLFRRRRPVALTVLAIPLGIVFAGAMGTVFVALFNLAIHRSRRVTAIVAGLHAATVLLTFRLAIEQPRAYWEAVGFLLALDAVLIASGLSIRSQRQLLAATRDRARQAEEEHRLRVEEARHLERERIAREMHDSLAHRISLLAVHAGALEFRRDAPDEEKRAAGIIRQNAYEALEDLREVIGVLRANPDGAGEERPQPTLDDLAELVEQARRAGEPVTLDNRIADPDGIPAGIGRHVYRIAQEGLTNARKHAPGAKVRVTLDRRAEGGVEIEVSNLLPAWPTPPVMPGAGTGLIGLRERVDLVGGRLEHGRTPDGSFRLRAWLPC